MASLHQRETIEHISRGIAAQGHAILEQVNLSHRYFTRHETKICFISHEGSYYTYVESDVQYLGDDDEMKGVFASQPQKGWKQLLIPASPNLGTILAYTDSVLGLAGGQPRVVWTLSSGTQTSGKTRTHTVQDTDAKHGADGRQSRTTFGEDLVALAAKGKLEQPVGRDTTMEAIIQVISKSKKNSCILLGEPGVGKTAIVEGLAMHIHTGNVPDSMREKRIYAINMGDLVAEAPYYNQLLARVKEMVDAAKRDERIILFIDEAHMLIDPKHDVSQILKADLGRNLRVIAATTNKDYHRSIAPDEAFARRFQRIPVPELSPEECLKVLQGVKGRYEKHHKVIIPDELLPWIIKVSIRYVKDRVLPDKALDLLDEACARLKLYA